MFPMSQVNTFWDGDGIVKRLIKSGPAVLTSSSLTVMFQPPHHLHPRLLHQRQRQVHHQASSAMGLFQISPPLLATTKAVQNMNQEAKIARCAVMDVTSLQIQTKEHSVWKTRSMC